MPRYCFPNGFTISVPQAKVDRVIHLLRFVNGSLAWTDMPVKQAIALVDFILYQAGLDWRYTAQQQGADTILTRVRGVVRRTRRNMTAYPDRGLAAATKYGWETLREGDSKVFTGATMSRLNSSWRAWLKAYDKVGRIKMRTQDDGSIVVTVIRLDNAVQNVDWEPETSFDTPRPNPLLPKRLREKRIAAGLKKQKSDYDRTLIPERDNSKPPAWLSAEQELEALLGPG